MRSQPRFSWTAGCLAIAAGVYYTVLTSEAVNDTFMHLAMARQVIGGDLPLRDFFDLGMVGMYAATAGAEALVGYRLLAEGLVVGLASGVSVFLVYRLASMLTASWPAAMAAAALPMLAGVRVYSYPKLLVYAVAATLWWAYVSTPSTGRAAALGAWVAAAFYWRPDHGVYVAIMAVLAVGAAHGLTRRAVVRVAQVGAVALTGVLPIFVFAASTVGFSSYVRDGVAMALAQHTETNEHVWPSWPIRHPGELVQVGDQQTFAPMAAIRWTADSTPAERDRILVRYGLTSVARTSEVTERVRLSAATLPELGRLVAEPVVEDTNGIDRGQGVPEWTTWQRWRFSHPWMRVRILPRLDDAVAAGEAVATLYYLLPFGAALAGLIGLGRHLSPVATGPRLTLFAVSGLVTAVGVMRTPYDVRAVDNVIMPSILLACVAVAAWRAGHGGGWPRRAIAATVTVALWMVVVKSVVSVGQVDARVEWLVGRGDAQVARQTWSDAWARLSASPPLAYWEGRGGAPVPIRLAQYANACVPPSKRILVLWFAPEIYYYADRLMASRHSFFDSGYPSMANEQRLTLEKIRRTEPVVAFAGSDLEGQKATLYPDVVRHVLEAYETVGTLPAEAGEQYRILARRDLSPRGQYGAERWPCYA